MSNKLPENIDQMEGFYKEQFQDFSPKVTNTVWENVSANIPTSASLGANVSTAYLLKVVGLLLAGIGTIAVVTHFFEAKKTTTPTIKQEHLVPAVTPTIEPVMHEAEETPTTEMVEEKVISEGLTPTKEVSTQPVTPKTVKTHEPLKNEAAEKTETTKAAPKAEKSDFQFVEEIEFE